MATYLDVMFDKRLSRVEEQIKQFKTSQGYGLQQMQTYASRNTVSVNSIGWYDQASGVTFQGVRAIIEYRGDYLNKKFIGSVYPWCTTSEAQKYLHWDLGIVNDSSLPDNTVRFEFVAQFVGVDQQDPYSPPFSRAFTVNFSGKGNMDGLLSVVDASPLNGLWG